MIILHDYWRSTASYRVRIALALKGVAYEQVTHDLLSGGQKDPGYTALNPQGLVPALQDGSVCVSQSLSILEWLEETQPEPALLPSRPEDRAIVRAMASTICCDIHPLNNLRVLQSLRNDLHATDEQVRAWIARWVCQGFDALEALLGRHEGTFCFGDQVTLADCCLIPQAYSAERFAVPLTPYPRICAVVAACEDIPAFQQAHPSAQPDAR